MTGLLPDELVIDSFAGGGGASLGISMALGRAPDIAINHDKEAIALHAANHPDSVHLSEDVWKVDPVEACQGRRVGLMWLSPDCKHFSKAKGGKPVSKKIRGLAWVAVRWAAAVKPRVIVLENVEEFKTWGPVLMATNRPCPDRKGKTFRAFKRKLERLGYAVEHRELRACDYGAPTIRKRLFLIARCDGQPIVWPAPTHGKGRPSPWRTAAECIEWSIPCPSIFERKKALANNTLRRIARGLDRFVINCAQPFIVSLTHHGNDGVDGLNAPLRTVTGAHRGEMALVTPYIAGVGGRAGQSPERSPGQPYQTITAKGDAALVAPTLIQTGYGERKGQAPRNLDLFEPLGTVVGGGVKHALVNAFLAKHYGGVVGSPMTEPVHTVTSTDHNALVTSNLLKLRGTTGAHLDSCASATDAPAPTISAGGWHLAEVRAFLVQYYSGGSQAASLFDPSPAVVSKDRLGLVTVHGEEYVITDIGMRMLAPRELYRAQGFPDSYRIELMYKGKPLSKTAQVRMVGNSVCPPLAAAIVAANYGTRDVRVAA